MTSSQPIIEYLKAQGTLWMPMPLKIKEGKKTPIRYKETNKIPTTNDFRDLPLSVIIERQGYKGYKHIAIDTGSKVQQIDIDDPAFQGQAKGKPHYLSATKQLPHIFAVFECDASETRNKIVLTDEPKIDLLNGLWAWADRDAVVLNSDVAPGKKIVPDQRPALKKALQKKETKYLDGYSTEYSGTNLKQIVDMISPNSYDNWFSVGTALATLGDNFKLWDEWSSRGSTYNSDEMLNKWEECKGHPEVAIGTLMRLAQEQTTDPAAYKAVKAQLINPEERIFITDCEGNEFYSLTNKSVAELFFNKFKDKYVFDKEWYMFEDKSGIMKQLDKKMVEAIMFGDCSDYLHALLTKIINNIPKEKKDFRDKMYKQLMKSQQSVFLKGAFAFKEARFADINFKKSLNSNQELLGFENGIYDMGTMSFRKGVKTDYVSSHRAFEWTPATDTQFFDNLIWSMFEDNIMVHWFKKHLGSIFVGDNIEELFYFWNGDGRNGKGTIDTLLRSTLGDFYSTLDAIYFTTQKKDTSAAQPEIVKLQNKKVAMVIEMGEEKLITQKVKQMAGNDATGARTLYKSEIKTVDFTFKTIVQTNHLPKFSLIDDGLVDRICPIPFPFRFVADHIFDKKNPMHRHCDENLKTNCKNKKVEFFNWVMEWCVPLYREEGLKPLPKKVEDNIKVFKKAIDNTSDYAETELRPRLGATKTFTEVWNHYRHWLKQICEIEKTPVRDNFAKRLKQLIGEDKYQKITKDGKQQRCIVGYDFINEYTFEADIYDNNEKYSTDF
tara:strand:+ start:1792 stop:4125 length:2334 start_codon:yes stop_codon:yes gene_type:complete